VLQPSIALRWLLCYEESDQDRVHLQKAAPKTWFAEKQRISVERCPTRYGEISWSTDATVTGCKTTISLPSGKPFNADIVLHVHPADGRALKSTSRGTLQGNTVTIAKADLEGKSTVDLDIS
jgi:hypothetical protein